MEQHHDKITGAVTLIEIKEFASFAAATQRYIRRSLDVAFKRHDAIAFWARDENEAASINVQKNVYECLYEIRDLMPRCASIEESEAFMGPLITLAAFDLGQNRINSFSAFRFLYERLIGAEARPWLPAIFCAAAAMPHLHPDMRKILLQSISEAAATATGWSRREPSFYPEWIEKVAVR